MLERLVERWRGNRGLGVVVIAVGLVIALIGVGLVMLTGDGGTARLGQLASSATPTSAPTEATGDDAIDDPTDEPTPDRPRKSAESDSTATTSGTGGSGGGSGGNGVDSPDEPDEPRKQHVEFDVSAVTSGGEHPETTISVRVHGAIGGNMWALFLEPQANETWAPTLSPDEDLPKCVNDDTVVRYDRTFTFHHHYRAAGEHRLIVQSYLGVCRDDGGPRWTGNIDVSKGNAHSNGPAPLELQAVEWQDFDGANRILVYATDVDGQIAKATIRWDNGTTATQTFETCPNGDVEDDRGWLDGEQYIEFPIEAAASSAEVTVTSTGCDGKDAETVSTTVDESDRPAY